MRVLLESRFALSNLVERLSFSKKEITCFGYTKKGETMRKILIISAFCCAVFGITGICSADSSKIIGGYWENWKLPFATKNLGASDPEYFATDIQSFTHIYYAFLTLDNSPNPDFPGQKQWDGSAIYETMTLAPIDEVMAETDPAWANGHNWQRAKIVALMNACESAGIKFIWAIGGWSDLTKTISADQIDSFTDKCIDLLKICGDGIDFDWEHFSEDLSIRAQQCETLATTMFILRAKMNQNGMSDKLIGYTTRFNAFWQTKDSPLWIKTSFTSAGEGIEIANYLAGMGCSLDDIVDWVNIMMYDVNPACLNTAEGKFAIDQYKDVLSAFENYVPKNKIVMGFEPASPQADSGIWEGEEVDKEVIEYVQANGYGGIMFWAANDRNSGGNGKCNGENSQKLAEYAKNKVFRY